MPDRTIEGVRVRTLVPHADERGSLTELLRADWPEFTGFGQAILTVNEPGVVRGWHAHRRQTDVIVVLAGSVAVALYDAREGSPTHGLVTEHVVSGPPAVLAIVVPPMVFHGYKTLGHASALIANFPDQLYDPARPDEIRLAPDVPHIPYDWGARH
jgi:dTDP-4-dehydrorhamnose 3,5-epimerase